MPGLLQYREFQPHALLAAHGQCYWTLSAREPVHLPAANHVFPDGCVDIIFNLGDSFAGITGNSTVGNGWKCFVAGAMRQPIITYHSGNIALAGVRFKPGGAYPFLRFPLSEITDWRVALDDMGERMRGMFRRDIDGNRVIADIDRCLLEELETALPIDEVVETAVSIINHAQGQIPVNFLGETLNISARQLERRFQVSVGLSPKMLCRIARIQAVISALRRQPDTAWLDIAHQNGFYDQSHFIREFKTLSGLTPNAYLRDCPISSTQ